MRELKKLVVTNNDGLRQTIPVLVRDNQVIAACHCKLAGKQYHALQFICRLFFDEVLELELKGKIKEGFIVLPEPINIDFLPATERKICQQIVEEDAEAEFWLY